MALFRFPTRPPSMTPLVTNTELLAVMKISRSTLLRLLDRGMPHYAEGRLRRFDLEAVLTWFTSDGEQDATDPASASSN